ncbi:NACHT domain-containing protein [Fusarium sp. LHS14.1]|nr:NACHT domain-containing protein [Fusarium sp. LHS14.1]
MLNLLQTLGRDDRFRNIQLFASSREYLDIQEAMLAIAEPLSLSNPWVEADIRPYIEEMINASRTFSRRPNELHQKVNEALAKGAKGMFRWAVCQLDNLRRLKTTDRIRKAISNLPETLDETYERMFSYIHADDRALVRHVLWWIHVYNTLWSSRVGDITTQILLDAYRMCEEEFGSPGFCLFNIGPLK